MIRQHSSFDGVRSKYMNHVIDELVFGINTVIFISPFINSEN